MLRGRITENTDSDDFDHDRPDSRKPANTEAMSVPAWSAGAERSRRAIVARRGATSFFIVRYRR